MAERTLLCRRWEHQVSRRGKFVARRFGTGSTSALGLDDESLKTLLHSHLKILGRKALAENVRDINGEKAIPDLMLWRRYADRSPGCHEHLVVELKRPSKKLGQDELSQIENYALTVSADERFDKGTTKWIFVLVGNDLDAFAEAKCEQEGRPFGLIVQKPHVEVWVKKWATIISECKWRHEFYRDKLDLQVQASDAAAYLQKKHAEYIPSVAKAEGSQLRPSRRSCASREDSGGIW